MYNIKITIKKGLKIQLQLRLKVIYIAWQIIKEFLKRSAGQTGLLKYLLFLKRRA